MVRPAEVVRVFGLFKPSLLAFGFGSLAALWFLAMPLALGVAVIREE